MLDLGPDHWGRLSRKRNLYDFFRPHFGAASPQGGHCNGLAMRSIESTLGPHAGKTQASPLEGTGTFRAQQAESSLQQIGRTEWWLWLSALLVTVLSATAFVLTAIPSYFRHSGAFLRNSLRPGAVGNPMSASSLQRLAGLQAMDVSATAEGAILE